MTVQPPFDEPQPGVRGQDSEREKRKDVPGLTPRLFPFWLVESLVLPESWVLQAAHVVKVGHQVKQKALHLRIEQSCLFQPWEEERYRHAETLKNLVHWNRNRAFETPLQLTISGLSDGFDGITYL